MVKAECRSVIYYSSGIFSPAVLDSLRAAGWMVYLVRNVNELSQMLSTKTVHVGLIEVNDQQDEEYLLRLDYVIRSCADVEWIGLFLPDHLDSYRLQGMISNLLYDFHTLPVEPKKLLAILGHVYGMTQIRWKLGKAQINHSELIGNSPKMQKLQLAIEKVAVVDAPVMINGESGTGKELVAKAIHKRSGFSDGPFVAVNCGSIVNDLVQSELFGHEKGAFTGALRRKDGYIEAASGGTLFLDEIGDLPLSQQINLLRFLQEKTIQRVGGTENIHVNVRVIAATHRDLELAVSEGEFREDLYYRLNVLHLKVPPLRKRDDDIELLADYFFEQFSKDKRRTVKGFSKNCYKTMRYYAWPGNVREMMNRIRRSMVMCDNGLIRETDLGIETTSSNFKWMPLKVVKEQAEQEAIRKALLETGHNITLTASNLGISRVMLHRLITKYETKPQNLKH